MSTTQHLTAPAAARTPVYRLTRRGRVVVVVLGLLVAFALGVMLAGGSFGAADEASSTTEVTVMPGDSLWSIASEVSDSGETRDVMRQIEDLNSLDSTSVDAGQRLLVPAAD